MLNRAIKEARRLISDLRPLIIEEAGVIEAINFLVDRAKSSSNMQIIYTHDPVIERFDPILEGVVFRIIQEAVTNALRHSQGTQVKINLTESNNILTIKVLDDGIGFDPAQVPENRFGIRGITERASLFDGIAKIKSQPDQGTKIIIKLPIARLENAKNSGGA
jgi:signal transduction histidine kinase